MVANSTSHKEHYSASAPKLGDGAPVVAKASGPNKLFNNLDERFGDWRDELLTNGFCIVKGAIPRDRAEQYGEEMFQYLENFAGGLGFKRDDPSTVKEANLPVINEKGMCHGYGVAHESFVWDIRQEPGVVGAFQKVYDTTDLIVSFDAVNFAFPNRADLKANKPWPHQDQDPKKPGFRCLQGLVNILPNGPNDGGLIVCKGAHLLSEEFHEEFKNEPDPIWAWTPEWYGFTDRGMEWLEKKGCEWIKLNAEPGDLLLWDSRTPHYNLSPTGTQPRFCAYTCYMPVSDVTREDLVIKQGAFTDLRSTTHWPNATHIGGPPVLRNGAPCPYNTVNKPRKAPALTEVGFKLTGIPYL